MGFTQPLRAGAGFTVLEMVIGLSVLGLLGISAFTLQNNLVTFTRWAEGGLNQQAKIRLIFKDFAKEVRSVSPSSNGAAPVETAQSATFSFFTDIDGDGLKERIRYFLSGSTLKKGVLKPVGTPSVYNPANEKVSAMITDITSPPTSFYYFDSTGTTLPLAQPVDVSVVRFVRIQFITDSNGAQPPGPETFEAQATLRNLRD